MWLVEVVRWTIAGLLGGLSAYVASCNAIILWLQHRRRGRAPSVGPLVGGLSGVLAVLVMPVGALGERAPYAVIPLVLDAGCLFYVALVVVSAAQGRL